jgi:hypothetical protein
MNTRTNHGALVPIERIEAAFVLPTPPPGMRWHREDGWKEGDLPPGTRPLAEHENELPTDEEFLGGSWQNGGSAGAAFTINKVRTTRPLTFTHSGREWTWHRAGDPMPCKPGDMIHVILADEPESANDPAIRGEQIEWDCQNAGDVIGWRYADTEKPDPYAELKKAHAAGKKIEGLIGGYWLPAHHPKWKYPVETYRVAESKLPETCNVPRAKPDKTPWIEWHGGECPLKDEEVEEWQVIRSNGAVSEPYTRIKPSEGSHWQSATPYKAYRVLKTREPKPKVPLGPEDVPPGSVFRGSAETEDKGWCIITSCSKTGIRYWRQSDNDPAELTWKTLQSLGAQINRPRLRDQDGNPTKWEPCEH